MRPAPARIGQKLADVLTPALIVSMPILEANEVAMRAAVRGTGVALPSFCLAQMLEAAAPPDVLLIEFAVNDGHWGIVHGMRATGSGAAARRALEPAGPPRFPSAA